MDSGRGMNDVALFPITQELLRYIDNESLNLENYRDNQFKGTLNKTTKIAERLSYLQVRISTLYRLSFFILTIECCAQAVRQEVGYKDETT